MQLAACREYAQAQGYEIVAEIQDDYTGTTLDRPGLNRVREIVQAGGAQVVICNEMDRMSRKLGHLLAIEEELKDAGAPVQYVKTQDEDTPEGNLMKHIRAAFC